MIKAGKAKRIHGFTSGRKNVSNANDVQTPLNGNLLLKPIKLSEKSPVLHQCLHSPGK